MGGAASRTSWTAMTMGRKQQKQAFSVSSATIRWLPNEWSIASVSCPCPIRFSRFK
jgi:hypothetical protein